MGSLRIDAFPTPESWQTSSYQNRLFHSRLPTHATTHATTSAQRHLYRATATTLSRKQKRFACGALNGSCNNGGFRTTVRRTSKEAIGHTRASSSESQTSSKNSRQSSLRRLGRSMLFRPRTSSQSTFACSPHIIEDGQLQESLMLMIAVDTPLPGRLRLMSKIFTTEKLRSKMVLL